MKNLNGLATSAAFGVENMSDLKILTICGVIILLGATINTGVILTPPPQVLVATYITMFITGLVAAWKLATLINKATYSHRMAVQARWGQAGLAAFEAMIYMSVADGDLADEEIKLISSISQRLFGSPASEQEIRTAAGQVLRKNIPIEDTLRGLDTRLNLEQRGMIIKAAFYVLKADGRADHAERALLSRMVTSLNYPTDELVKITSDFLQDQ